MKHLPTPLRERVRAAAAHPRVHGMGNRGLLGLQHALLLPLVWTVIRHSAFGGANVRRLALDHVPPAAWQEGGLLLDLGCSVGGMTQPLLARATRQQRVVGIDASQPMLAVARVLHPAVEFREANVCFALGVEEDVAVATLAFVLHEMPPEAQRLALRNALRALRGKGCLCIVDIGPDTSPNTTAHTGYEPFLATYLTGVEAVIAESASLHHRRVVKRVDFRGARAWIVR